MAGPCMEMYTRRPSRVTTSRCSRLDSRGGMTAMWAMAAPFLSLAVRPPKMSRPGACVRRVFELLCCVVESEPAHRCFVSAAQGTKLIRGKLLQPYRREH